MWQSKTVMELKVHYLQDYRVSKKSGMFVQMAINNLKYLRNWKFLDFFLENTAYIFHHRYSIKQTDFVVYHAEFMRNLPKHPKRDFRLFIHGQLNNNHLTFLATLYYYWVCMHDYDVYVFYIFIKCLPILWFVS